jgi:2-oxoglutarate dehydrogenase E2 component (dihydrolipoamide succinyltransferase)
MPIDIVIPTVGESITSGVLAKWLKGDGDVAAKDEVVAEVETDKITLELRAPEAGVLKRLAKEGDTVEVGAVVGTVDPAGASNGKPAGAGSSAKAESATAVASPPARTAAPPAAPKAAPAPAAPVSNGSDSDRDARATPLARKLAIEHKLDLSRIPGTGAGGRVREQDVLAVVQGKQDRAPSAQAGSPRPAGGTAATPGPSATQPPAPGSRPVTRERMSPLRTRIASRLVEAQHTAAMLTTFNEADMGGVLELRKQYKEDFEKKHGIGLGFMSFFIKAAVQALKAFPLVNAYIVDDGGQPAIEKHAYFDIAVAVSTPKGLVVPVVRNCETLSFAQIEAAIKDLATRAKGGKLSLEEMQGGTFTITNGGVFGSLLSTPILNPPQSAILGMHAIKNRAVEDPKNPGQIALRPMMYLALSYDHRIVDGSEAVQFLVKIKQAIEDPQRLLLEL